MTRRTEIWRLINPVTDLPAVVAILLGLSIAVFLDEVAVQLIGVCVGILGIVALFLLFSQRMKDLALHATKPSAASETTAFKTTVKQDPTTKRLIFDDFADSFGADDFAPEGPGNEAASGTLPDPETADASNNAPVEKVAAAPDISKTDDFEDGVEGFRIISPAEKSSTETPNSTVTPPEAITDKTETVKPAVPKIADTKTESIAGPEVVFEQEAQAEKPQAATAPTPAPEEQTQQGEAAAPEQDSAAVDAQKTRNEQTQSTATDSNRGDLTQPLFELEATKPKSEEAPEPVADEETDESLTMEEGASAVGHKRKKVDIQLTEIFEASLDTLKKEPRKEFDYLLSRVLMVIRSVMSARTAIFLWVNFDKEELVIESKISDISDALQDRRKLGFGNDVITQIAVNGAPEILTEINPNAELDLIPYYQAPANTRSFVGVPVYFNNTVVGILTADTNAEDAYDSQSVSFLGHFTKLISGLIQGYTEKYDLMQSARTLESIDAFRNLSNDPRNTREDVCFSLIDTLTQMLPYSMIGICIFDDATGTWKIAEMRSKGASEEFVGAIVDLEHSLIGQTITTGEMRQFRDIAPEVIRVTDAEAPLKNAVYTFIPVKSYSRCYGAVFVESPDNATLTKQDIQILSMLTEYAGSILEQMQLNALIQDNAMIDESTGVLNSSAFQARLGEEFVRATDMNLALTTCLIIVDQYLSLESTFNTEAAEITANHVLGILQKHVRPYDILGRYNTNTLGIGLVQKNSQDSKLWAERLRKECASAIMDYNGRQFSVTISVGVAEYTQQQSLEELMSNAEQVLDIAARKSNAVVVYS